MLALTAVSSGAEQVANRIDKATETDESRVSREAVRRRVWLRHWGFSRVSSVLTRILLSIDDRKEGVKAYFKVH